MAFNFELQFKILKRSFKILNVQTFETKFQKFERSSNFARGARDLAGARCRGGSTGRAGGVDGEAKQALFFALRSGPKGRFARSANELRSFALRAN